MSKQDRQGVRKASDLERKYNLGLLAGSGHGKAGSLAEQINKLSQSFSQFATSCMGRLKELEEKVDALSLDYTVTFLVDGVVYESVGVKNGHAVNAPATEPTGKSGTFVSWQLNGEDVIFPYTPTADTELVALFE